MNRLLISSLLVLLCSFAEAGSTMKYGIDARNDVDAACELRYTDGQEIPSYIEFCASSQIDFANWQNWFKSEFNLESNYGFELLNSINDQFGTHYRYKQTYSGYSVDIAHIIIHTNTNGKVKSINGFAINQKQLNTRPTLSFDEGLSSAKNAMGARIYKWEIPEEETHLKAEQNDLNASYYPSGDLVFITKNASSTSSNIRLARLYDLYSQEPLSRIKFYIDAVNGEILLEEELIHTTNKPGTANTGYSGTRAIVADSVSDNLYHLTETTRGQGVFTYDMNQSTMHSQAVHFVDSDNVWSNFNGSLDQFAGDAHWGAEMTYDYLDSIHQRNSIDNAGFALRSYVHYGNQYNNAFWDGQRMTYGDGNATNTPLTSIDIAGHEIAHGLTNFTAGLRYRSESGALNESFSDIFGVAVENYGRPNNWNWLMGEDIGSAFRSIANPKLYGDPNTYDGVNWISQNCVPTRNNDWCGVHTNSGVQNYWFFLLTQGGSGTNDKGDTFSVTGLGIVDAAKVAFRNLTVYLGPNSNHDDARFYAIKSAIDLYGGCSFEVEQVTNAWYAVGVGNQYTPGVDATFNSIKDTVFCQVPSLVNFTSNQNNVISYKWLFGDGDSSNLPNPSHVYNSVGLYTVSLIVDGGVCGKDTLVRPTYINVDTNNYCSYAMLRNNTISVLDCSGRFFDNGGLNGDYEINSYDTIILEPTNADFIYLMFDSLKIESGFNGYCNHDYLEIFDGGSVNSRSLGRFCSANLPPDTIISSTPKLTIVLSSDQMSPDFGVSAFWECQSAVLSPAANFTVKFDTTCNGFNSFQDMSVNGVSSWLWNFGDGNTSTDQNPNHEYTANGTYTVSLSVNNSVGNDIETKVASVVVNRPLDPITTNDTNCINGNFKMAASGAGVLNWYQSQSAANPLFAGDTLRYNRLANDTSFFVSSFVEQPRIIGSPFFINGNGGVSDTSAEMYFEVHKRTLLESIIFRSTRSGIRKIDLKNSRGEIIDSRDINISNVPQQIQLDFEISPGSGYSLSVGSRNPSGYVNFTGANYPYNVGGLMSLTGSSLGNQAYPFFYYVVARELPCRSNRVMVSALVDTSCVITGINEQFNTNSTFTVYPNPSNDFIVINNQESSSFSYQIFDLVGKLYLEKLSISKVSERIQIADLPNGVYLLRINSEGKVLTHKIVKQ